MKRVIAIFLAAVLLLGLIPFASAEAGMGNFKRSQSYTAGQFADVKTSDWFVSGVQSAFELGLMKGSGDGAFKPAGNLTVAEALAIACRLHGIYAANGQTFTQGNPWYQVYVDYAVSNKIMAAGKLDPKKQITREQFAYLMCGALPEEELKTVNAVTSIPDVAEKSDYGRFVYCLYRAGILTGSDKNGTFRPTTAIQRSEVAAIVTRMADKAQRKSVTLVTASDTERFSAQITKLGREDFNACLDGFEPGMLDIDTGVPKENPTILRSKEFFSVPKRDTLCFTIPAEAFLWVFRYEKDGTMSECQPFWGVGGGGNSYIVFPKYQYKIAYSTGTGAVVNESSLPKIAGQFCVALRSDARNNVLFRNRDKDAAMLELMQRSAQATGDSYQPLTFVHISDIHSQREEWDDVCDYLDHWDHVVQFAIHTGDMAGNCLEDLVNFYTYRLPKRIRIFNAIGNHDVYKSYNPIKDATRAETYAAIFAPADTDAWDVQFGPGENSMYYYKDFPEQGIRLVVIDPYFWNEKEADWLDAVLNEAKAENLAVISVAHERGAEVESAGTTFYRLDKVNRKLTVTDFYPHLVRFVRRGGEHIVHLSGHFHHDKFGLTKEGILVSQVECATHNNHQTDTVRTPEPFGYLQKSFDCFNVMQVDRAKGQIRIVRIGVNQSKNGQARNTLCYDYVNHKIISNT